MSTSMRSLLDAEGRAMYDIRFSSVQISVAERSSPQHELMYEISAVVDLGVISGTSRDSWLCGERILTGSTLFRMVSRNCSWWCNMTYVKGSSQYPENIATKICVTTSAF